jgi:L-seryl-tRNA(Ser) seleniumtransferase
MGMLMAVEMWTKRDHDAEWKQWMGWLNHIGEQAATIPGVTFTVRETKELSNHTPTVSIRWDGAALGITGDEVANHLFTTEPRISLNGGGGGGRRGGGGGGTETGISIAAHMMEPGDDKIVAGRIVAALKGAKKQPAQPKAAPATDISGVWNVHIEYASSSSNHSLFVRQLDGGRLQGTHQGDFISRDLTGAIEGDSVRLASSIQESHGDSIGYRFTGTVQGDTMSGNLDLGEYLAAKWTASRHQFRGGRG